MNTEYIIVQAGGRGSRLEYLTDNKPKAIVPVENKPMLFHLFNQFPDKKYIIIGDYQKDVLKSYLECFANVIYQVVDAKGKGTCSGIRQAVELLPEGQPFMLMWSDLILPDSFAFPEENDNYLGVSETFPCRWSCHNGDLVEQPSTEEGVAGLFIFKDKSILNGVPTEGEFVRWLQQKQITYKTIGLAGTKEYGTLSEYLKLPNEKCRPFNRMYERDGMLIKEGIDEQGKKLAVKEQLWYRKVNELGINGIPHIYGFDPLVMEKINGKNIYEYTLSYEQKKNILTALVEVLKKLHKTEKTQRDTFSLKEAYYGKTFDRIDKIRDLVPFANERIITVNGRQCRNVFFYRKELEQKIEGLINECTDFCFIHGDCTFSNMMLDEENSPVLIDPRGYFGYTSLYGDEMYDWAKLYYSLVGNYDRFNLKKFRLMINESDVKLEIESNGWEEMEEDFFKLTGADRNAIKLIHAIIWLSLTTYAWQDYDSICGAFYQGLYYLEEVL